jgi:hypothetical protein
MNTDCQLELKWLIKTYETTTNKAKFFNPFTKLAGTQNPTTIEDGKSEADIRKSWETGLEKFKKMRAKYLIYKKHQLFSILIIMAIFLHFFYYKSSRANWDILQSKV